MTSAPRSQQPKPYTSAEDSNSSPKMETPIGFTIATVWSIVRGDHAFYALRCTSTAAHALDRLWNVILRLVIHLQAKSNAWPAYPHLLLHNLQLQRSVSQCGVHTRRRPRDALGRLLGVALDIPLDGGAYRWRLWNRKCKNRTAKAAQLIFTSPGTKACRTCSQDWTTMPSRSAPSSNKRYHVCDVADGKFGIPFANSSSSAKTHWK